MGATELCRSQPARRTWHAAAGLGALAAGRARLVSKVHCQAAALVDGGEILLAAARALVGGVATAGHRGGADQRAAAAAGWEDGAVGREQVVGQGSGSAWVGLGRHCDANRQSRPRPASQRGKCARALSRMHPTRPWPRLSQRTRTHPPASNTALLAHTLLRTCGAAARGCSCECPAAAWSPRCCAC